MSTRYLVEKSSTLHLQLSGHDDHKLATAVIATVALIKHYGVRNTYAPGSDGANPDLAIYKEDIFLDQGRKVRRVATYVCEVIVHNDPIPGWVKSGIHQADILRFDCRGLTLDAVRDLAMRVIP